MVCHLQPSLSPSPPPVHLKLQQETKWGKEFPSKSFGFIVRYDCRKAVTSSHRWSYISTNIMSRMKQYKSSYMFRVPKDSTLRSSEDCLNCYTKTTETCPLPRKVWCFPLQRTFPMFKSIRLAILFMPEVAFMWRTSVATSTTYTCWMTRRELA